MASSTSWGLTLRLVRRELRVGLKNFRVFLACLALGVGTIATVQTISHVALTSLQADAKPILGGDFSVRQDFNPLSQDALDWLSEVGTISQTITFRSMGQPDTEALPGLVEVKGVEPDSYPLYGEVLTTPAFLSVAEALSQQPDGRWGAMLEPAAAARYETQVGDTLTVGDLALTVTAILDREPDRLGGGGIVLAPRVMIDRAALQGSSLLSAGAQIKYGVNVRLPEGAPLAEIQQSLREAFPEAAWQVTSYDRANSRIESIILRITLFMTLVGLSTLLVGGVGVSNAVRAFMDMKLRTIAILKSVGAPRALVTRIYVLQVTVFAGIGILIGLVIGTILPLIGLKAAEDLLPFTITTTVYPAGLALAALFGFLIAWAFSLWPIGKAGLIRPAALFRTRIATPDGQPPRGMAYAAVGLGLALAALAIATAENWVLAAGFVGASLIVFEAFRLAGFGVMALARRITHPGRATVRLALANLHRPGAPTPAVILSLGLGLTVLVTIALIRGNVENQLAEDLPNRAPSFFFVDIQKDQEQAFIDTITGIEGTTRFNIQPQVRGIITQVNGVDAYDAVVNRDEAWFLRGDRAFNYAARSLYTQEETLMGQWWPEDYRAERGNPDKPQLISVDKDVIAAFGIGLGDEITVEFSGRPITGQIAHVRDTNWRSGQINFAITYSPGILEAAPRTSLATVYADDGAYERILRTVPQAFPNVSAIPVRDALGRLEEIINGVTAAITLTALLSIIAGALVLAGALAAERRQRIYDAVVLKVLGATRRDVLTAYLLQYGGLGVVTALVAGAVGTIAAWSVVVFVFNATWVFLPSAIALTLGIALLLTLGLGFLGTWRALSAKAAPLLRNE